MLRKTVWMALIGMALALIPLHAGNTSAQLEQIAADAQKAQQEARDIAALLKQRSPDVEQVRNKTSQLEQHAVSLRRWIQEFEAAHPNLTDAQRKELGTMKQTSEILAIFVTNKKEMLASSDAMKRRAILRAKAEGIAMRAERVQQSAQRIRS